MAFNNKNLRNKEVRFILAILLKGVVKTMPFLYLSELTDLNHVHILLDYIEEISHSKRNESGKITNSKQLFCSNFGFIVKAQDLLFLSNNKIDNNLNNCMVTKTDE